MYITPKCPNCGGEVLLEDTFDIEYGKTECLIFHVGTCKTCRHVIDWVGVYLFAENAEIVDTGLK